jgi:AbrB family looped-hinge helix DNA binding protein
MGSVPVSTKGQVVIPKEIRAALGLAPGARVEIVLEGTSVRITPARGPKSATLAGIQRRLAYRGPRISVDDMRVTNYSG